MIESFASAAEFPTCTSSRKDSLVYSKTERSIYICDGEAYTKTFSNAAGDSPAISNVTCAAAKPSLPQPTGINGALAFSLPLDVDPCSVSGYVVGKQGELKVEVTQDGVFYVNNVPPGEHDVVITAGTLKIITGLTESAVDVGLRLNQVPSITGIANKLGTIGLQKFGSISGKATLLGNYGIADFAGITVYIPGTSYSALTDDAGNFSITGVPPGSHNLYFDKDGFGRGQLGNVLVASEKTTSVDDVKLGLSTNVSGTFLITNSFLEGTTKFIAGSTANVQMIPSSKSVLMMLNHYPNEGLWEPIKTNASLKLNIDGLINEQLQYSTQTFLTSPINVSISTKFADSNGLESDTIYKSYSFDLFSDGVQSFRPIFDASLARSPLRIEISSVVNPNQAERAAVEHIRSSDNNNHNEGFASLFSTKTIYLKDQAINCGMHQIGITYEGYQGRAQSSNYNYNVINPTSFFKYPWNKCYSDVTDVGAPLNRGSDESYPSNNNSYYNAVWTGSKIFVLGYALDESPTGGIYSPETDSWAAINFAGIYSPSQSMRTFRLYHALNKIIVLASANNYSSYISKMFVYDLTSSAWINPDPMTTQPDFASHPWTYSKPYLIGNQLVLLNESGSLNPGTGIYEMTFRKYDASATSGVDPWSDEIFIGGQVPSYYSVGANINGKLLLAGGQIGNSSSNRVILVDISDGSSVTKNSLPGGFGLSTNGNEISTGRVSADNPDTVQFYLSGNGFDIYRYSIISDSWTVQRMSSSGIDFNYVALGFSGNDFVIAGTSKFKFFKSGDNQTNTGRFGRQDYNSTDLQSWAVPSPNVSLLIPSIKKMFMWGGRVQSYSLNGTLTYTDNRKGIMVNLDYPDNWAP